MAAPQEVTFKASDLLSRSIDASTHKLNEMLEKSTSASVRWYEVGAAEFRRTVYAGETQFPVPPLLPNAKDDTVPSRESDRHVPVRIYKPDNRESSKGAYLYFHGGGFVMGSHKD
jgi:acetyl esterase/lipase